MKRIVFCAITAFLFFGATDLHAQQTRSRLQDTKSKIQDTKSRLQDMFVSYLKAEGYRPEIDSDGDVKFTAEGLSLYVDIDEQVKDPNYFRIVLQTPTVYKTDAERKKVFEAINVASRTTRVAKVYVTTSDKVAIVAEGFIEKADDAKLHFKRMVNAMLVARKTFAENM